MHMRGPVVLSLLLLLSSVLPAQTPTPSPSPSPSPSTTGNFIRDVGKDEKALVTKPFKMGKPELKWIIPLTLATGAVIAADRHTSGWVSRGGSLAPVAHKIRWGGSLYTTGGLSGGLYLLGRARGDDHLRETGRLSLEALADVALLTEGLKYAFQRSRPNVDGGSGEFWEGGKSFPSGHASQSWAVATVIAHEYKDHKWIKIAAYAAASAISASRYAGRSHFVSDIVVGSALGYGTGLLVYRMHH
ncbi:MAG: phosphatase PAP2 family protein [Acidobacteria bacterium]|nr:phosphatase PAP2 family protein [Acidobacteriota bacterium]